VASTPANRTPLIVLSIAGLVIAASCWGLYSSEGAVKARERDARLAEAEQGGAASEGPRTVVDVVTVKRAPAAEVVELSGVLEAIRSTWVAAEIAGSILAVPAKEHTPIEQGGVLVRLDPALPRAELIRAQASYDLAKAELDRAVAEERRSYAALLEARARLGHTTISAPFDGLVNSLDLDPGAFVSPGTPIAEVLDVSTLELTVPVSDRQIGAIAVGDVARVRVDPLGNRLVEGKVVRKGRAPQAETQRYPVVIELSGDEAGRALLPGMLAHAMLEVGTAPTIRLPSQAVIRQFELDYVYEIDSQDVAKRVRVSTRPVPFRPDQVEVQEGLADGARVAVSAISQLRNGVAVDARAVPAP
jgi:membrane fusion protein (multidrug efflux system)